MFTSDHNSLMARLAMAPAPGRAALPYDTSTYLEDLGRAAEMAATEVTAARLTATMRAVLTPYGINTHADGTRPPDLDDDLADRAAHLYPPLAVWGEIQRADADRAEAINGIATLTAAQFAAGALHALRAVLNGYELTPARLELRAAERSHRLNRGRSEPVYGRTMRPALPELAALATGHNDLDLTVGGAYVPLWECYAAAERLEAADLAAAPTDGQPPTPPALDAVEATGCAAEASMLAPLLVAFGHACLDAARYGHVPVITTPAAPPAEGVRVIELHDGGGIKLVADADGVKRVTAAATLVTGEAKQI